MRISACVIAKNEEKNIPKWLQSVSKIADEMIVVDTGSTDNTKKIAMLAGASVYDFKWCDDFAAAKNCAIDKASGDWIIFTDADEYFLEEMSELIINKINEIDANKKIDALICKLINIDADNNNKFINSIYQLRIFRNVSYLRYRGRIHETLKHNDKIPSLLVLPTNIYIYHTGYSQSINLKKGERNLKILKEEIKINGELPEYYKPLADCYYGLKQYDKVIYYNKKIIDSGLHLVGIETDMYLQYINAMCMLDKPMADIKKIIDKGIKSYPNSPDLNYQKGFSLCEEGEFINAEKYLERSLDLHFHQQEVGLSQIETSLFLIYGLLGDIAKYKKQEKQAIQWYIKSLKADPCTRRFFDELYTLIKRRLPKVKINLLNKIYTKEHKDFLLRALQAMGEYKLYLYYEKVYNNEVNHNKVIESFANEDYRAAAKYIAAELNKNYKAILFNSLQTGNELSDTAMCILPKGYKIAYCQVKNKMQQNA